MHAKLVGFNCFRDLLANDPCFAPVVDDVLVGRCSDFVLHNRFLFRGNQLCDPLSSLRLKIIQELHCEGEYFKLAARKIGHLEIVAKINPNAYRLKLPSHISTFHMFNVKHLVPVQSDLPDAFQCLNSRANSFRLGEDDADAVIDKNDNDVLIFQTSQFSPEDIDFWIFVESTDLNVVIDIMFVYNILPCIKIVVGSEHSLEEALAIHFGIQVASDSDLLQKRLNMMLSMVQLILGPSDAIAF
ncbi:hypothetical protein JRO89_XS15G0034800 [Xanthoceras sorbifolium]|uniref:Tf2-1-like SH3-like domain-containing protein n=1 Tax=Xanthoceras sorbifolium TaxID=99658 RepID=A0ABQ8H0X3_9ROSI|nr:hypothetical protein JRO89_XS15G0034800 [Xanthoceras sorbifolium]